MKRISILLVAGLIAWAAVSLATTWDAAFEASPAGTDLVSTLDTVIQNMKLEIRRRGSVETIYGTGSDDNGLARLGSARVFIQNADPTDLDGPGQYNSSASVFAGTALLTDEVGATTRDLGAGRLWVDADGDSTSLTTDDNQLHVWNEASDAFVPVTAAGSGARTLGENLILHGSFEVTDGTGSAASTTVASGWTNLNTADIAYDSVANSTEGDGLAMETIANGGANEGATQTLAGLKESTAYVIRARVRPVVGTCDLQVTGGAVTPVTDTSDAATGVFETLEVIATTDATPADLVVRLESNVAGDECDWDHVTAFEQSAVVAPPGIQAIFTQDSVNDATLDAVFGNNPFLSTSVTIPSSGYIVTVDVVASVLGDEEVYGRIARNDCAGGAFTAVTPVVGIRDDFVIGPYQLVLNFVDTAPVVGGTCIYRLEIREEDASNAQFNPVGDGAVQTGSSLRLMLMPAR